MSQALYAYKTRDYDDIHAAKWQTVQVSTISVTSWAGRIILGPFISSVLTLRLTDTGMMCDYGKNKLGVPRSYSLVLVSSLFVVSQVVIACIDIVEHLWIASSFLGFAYGSAYSLFATMCIEWFGLRRFPCLTGNTCTKAPVDSPLFGELGLPHAGSHRGRQYILAYVWVQPRCTRDAPTAPGVETFGFSPLGDDASAVHAWEGMLRRHGVCDDGGVFCGRAVELLGVLERSEEDRNGCRRVDQSSDRGYTSGLILFYIITSSRRLFVSLLIYNEQARCSLRRPTSRLPRRFGYFYLHRWRRSAYHLPSGVCGQSLSSSPRPPRRSRMGRWRLLF